MNFALTSFRPSVTSLGLGSFPVTTLLSVFLAAFGSVEAAELPLSGIAAGDTRWFEMYSDAYVQLDQGLGGNPQADGFFLVFGGSPTPQQLAEFNPQTFAPTTFNGIGSGVDAFPRDEAFNLGALTYNETGLTGAGFESAPITGYTVDFDENIADDDAIVSTGYATTIGAVSGELHFYKSRLIGLEMTAAITFTYDFSAFGEGSLPYTGTFSVSGNRFELFVDGTHPTTVSPLRYIWDSSGSIDQVLPLAGDYDGDLDVDGADFLVWQRALGTTTSPFSGADGDGNGEVTGSDLTVWQANFGVTAPSTVASTIAVPEPALLASFGFALTFMATRLRKCPCCVRRGN